MVGVDEQDPATHKLKEREIEDYTSYLHIDGLKDARIGVFTHGSDEFYNSDEYDGELFENAVQTLHDQGATVVKDIEIPAFHRERNGAVLLYELKHSLDNYLSKLPPQQPVHSFSELIQFNKDHADRALKNGQDRLELREHLPNTLSNPEYLTARLEDIYFSEQQGIGFALKNTI